MQQPPNVKALTAPTQIEGDYTSTLTLAQDPTSDGLALTKFSLQAESAVKRCNIDKSLLREYLAPATIKECKWYDLSCKHGEKK